MVPNHVRYQTALHLEDFSLNYIFYFISGRGGGTRTPGARFWRPTLYQLSYTHHILVEVEGLEPPAPWSQTTCATKLRYTSKYLLNIYLVDHQGLEPQTYRL